MYDETALETQHTISHHCLIDRVGGLVTEDAGGEARDNLHYTRQAAAVQHIVVDQHVVALGIEHHFSTGWFHNYFFLHCYLPMLLEVIM